MFKIYAYETVNLEKKEHTESPSKEVQSKVEMKPISVIPTTTQKPAQTVKTTTQPATKTGKI